MIATHTIYTFELICQYVVVDSQLPFTSQIHPKVMPLRVKRCISLSSFSPSHISFSLSCKQFIIHIWLLVSVFKAVLTVGSSAHKIQHTSDKRQELKSNYREYQVFILNVAEFLCQYLQTQVCPMNECKKRTRNINSNNTKTLILKGEREVTSIQ